jgi:hypothetical protein
VTILVAFLLLNVLGVGPMDAVTLRPVKTAWEAQLATGGNVILALSTNARSGGTFDLELSGLTPKQTMKVTFFAGTCAKRGKLVTTLAPLTSNDPEYYGGYRLNTRTFSLFTSALKKGSLSVTIGSSQRCGTFAKPVNCLARATAAPFTWKMAIIVYPSATVTYDQLDGTPVSVTTQMTPDELNVVQTSATGMEALANQWSGGELQLQVDVLVMDHPLTSLTLHTANATANYYFITTADVESDLRAQAPDGDYDSIITVWKPWNEQGQAVPTDYWGEGSGTNTASDGSTFATVILGNAAAWGQPGLNSEVLMHEWIHGIVDYYDAMTGLTLPSPDDRAADGYEPLTIAAGGSQARFDGDLLTGQIVNQVTGVPIGGITPAIWGSGSPRTRPGICYLRSH